VSLGLSSLHAYAYRNRVVERLAKHLEKSAYCAYTMARVKSVELGRAAILAGLLHDVGKALKLYQQCMLVSQRGECLYTAHEVASALIAKKILRDLHTIDSVYRGCILWATLYHHQAMGSPLERLDRLVKSVKSVSTEMFSIDNRLGDEITNAIENLYQRVDPEIRDVVEYLKHVVKDLDWHALGIEVAKVLSNLSVMSVERVWEDILERVFRHIEVVELRDELLCRVLTGIIILSDIYTASRTRADGKRHLLASCLERYLRFLDS